MKVTDATPADIQRFFGIKMPYHWEGIVAKEGNLITGIGGVYVEHSGRVMGWMHLTPFTRKAIAFRYVIMYLRKLRDRGVDEISVKCDTNIGRAEAFLERLGFARTGNVEDNMEVWTWQRS